MKIFYENKINGVDVSFEISNHIMGYNIGSLGGLMSYSDLGYYIAFVETNDIVALQDASTHKIAFINDLVRQGCLSKEEYMAIYSDKDSSRIYDLLIKE